MKISSRFIFPVAALILYTTIYIFTIHSITVRKIQRIKNLEHQTVSVEQIKNTLRKEINEVSTNEDIKNFLHELNLQQPVNTVVFSVGGKGLPNFRGAIFLDTISKRVEMVYINELR